MRILYDENIFLSQKVGGISRYHYELFKGMSAFGIEASISGIFIKNKYILEDENFKNKFIADPCALFSYINKITTIRKVKSIGKYDILHLTGYYDYLTTAIPKNAKVVITIHDMIPEKELSIPNPLKKYYAERADKIIAVSEKTKKDIIEILGVDQNKIHVIYHGSSLSSDQIKPVNDLPTSYVLFVGQREGYKNFTKFIEGLAPILKQDSSLNLVCTGRRNITEMEQNHFKKLGVEDRVYFYNNVDDSSLAYLYRNAKVFVFPSLYEGFGIPILEAWSCQTPVILSDNECFREIADKAGYYFQPQNTADITQKINNVLVNPQLMNSLREKGEQRLLKYSWSQAVKETIEVYKSLL